MPRKIIFFCLLLCAALPMSAQDRLDSKSFDNPDTRYALNLGRLSAVASVRLNGKALQDVWHDDTDLLVDALLPEGNVLEVRVATTLHNRIAADVKAYGRPVAIETPSSSGTMSYYARSEAFESGLLGPLSISVFER